MDLNFVGWLPLQLRQRRLWVAKALRDAALGLVWSLNYVYYFITHPAKSGCDKWTANNTQSWKSEIARFGFEDCNRPSQTGFVTTKGLFAILSRMLQNRKADASQLRAVDRVLEQMCDAYGAWEDFSVFVGPIEIPVRAGKIDIPDALRSLGAESALRVWKLWSPELLPDPSGRVYISKVLLFLLRVQDHRSSLTGQAHSWLWRFLKALLLEVAPRIDRGVIEDRNTMLIQELPDNAVMSFDRVHEPSIVHQSKTRVDPQVYALEAAKMRESHGTVLPGVDGRVERGHVLGIENMLYLACHSTSFEDAVEASGVLGLLTDAGRFSDQHAFASHLATPSTARTAEKEVETCEGRCGLLMTLPDLNVDLKAKSVGLRIEEAREKPLTERKGMIPKPKADVKHPTQIVLQSWQGASASQVHGGMARFNSLATLKPLEAKSQGIYRTENGRVKIVWPGDSKRAQVWAIPRPIEDRRVRPLVVFINDAGTDVFAACMHMWIQSHVRCFVHLGPCHGESNEPSNVMRHAGLEEHQKKLLFLSRFRSGPWAMKEGEGKRWRAMQKESFAHATEEIFTEGSEIAALFKEYAPRIIVEAGGANADVDGCLDICMDFIAARVVRKAKEDGSTSRWFAADKSGARLDRIRYSLMFVNDCTIILANASPFGHVVEPDRSMADIWARCGQSLQVAAYLLRDDHFFIVEKLRRGINAPLVKAHAERIGKDRRHPSGDEEKPPLGAPALTRQVHLIENRSPTINPAGHVKDHTVGFQRN